MDDRRSAEFPPDEPARPVGARFHAPKQRGAPAAERVPGQFPVVMRGYDRRAVDARLAELSAEVARLRAECAEREARWRDSRQQVAALLTQLHARPPGATGADTAATDVAEKVLRHARMEASLIRAAATREAETLVARARSESGPDTPAP